MKIEMPRGDIRRVSFEVTGPDGQPIDFEFQEIYVTFKQTFKNQNYLFQKRLTTGDIRNDSGVYEFTIQPEDTNNLIFGDYVFDIEFIAQNLKETHTGTLTLTPEATYQQNEG